MPRVVEGAEVRDYLSRELRSGQRQPPPAPPWEGGGNE